MSVGRCRNPLVTRYLQLSCCTLEVFCLAFMCTSLHHLTVMHLQAQNCCKPQGLAMIGRQSLLRSLHATNMP